MTHIWLIHRGSSLPVFFLLLKKTAFQGWRILFNPNNKKTDFRIIQIENVLHTHHANTAELTSRQKMNLSSLKRRGDINCEFSQLVSPSVNCPYLIFVTNAANAVRVKFLAECKKNPEKRENYCFGLNLYHNSDHVNVLFYTKCAILHRYRCFTLHLVFDFTLGV